MKKDKWKWLKELWLEIDDIKVRLAVLEYIVREIRNVKKSELADDSVEWEPDKSQVLSIEEILKKMDKDKKNARPKRKKASTK